MVIIVPTAAGIFTATKWCAVRFVGTRGLGSEVMDSDNQPAKLPRWRWRPRGSTKIQHDCLGTVFVGGDTLRANEMPPPIIHIAGGPEYDAADEGPELAAYLNSLETDLAALRGLVEEAPVLRDGGVGSAWLDRAAKLLTGGKDD